MSCRAAKTQWAGFDPFLAVRSPFTPVLVMEFCLAIISDTVWFTPALLVMLALTALFWELTHQRSRVLLYGSVPRPPAESIRLTLDEMNEKLVVRILFTIGFALIAGVAAKAVANGNNFALVYAVLFTGSCVALGLTLWTWKLVTRWRRSQLGFEGERMVGRQLNLLMLDGCRVFHDLADKAIGNIDHIIVAPHAIFAVETLTLHRRASQSGGNNQPVIFNGRELRFPTFATRKPLNQAIRNARWLEKHLLRTTGLQLPVHPILTIPGWSVTSVNTAPVLVLNPNEIGSTIVDKAAKPIYDAQRQRIINFLDERCQYVPF